MASFKELPIELKALVISECWTYNKLAIIQTSPYANDWLASHLSIYMDHYFEIFFGNYQFYYEPNILNRRSFFSPSYYDDILIVNNIGISKIDQSIIKVIIDEVDQNKYVILDIDLSNGIDTILYPILIFGYDLHKQTFIIPQKNSFKVFERGEITFEDIIKAFSNASKVYQKNNDIKIGRALVENFAITSVSLRDYYSAGNCAYSAIRKILKEINGLKLKITPLNICADEEYNNYTGIACLIGLAEGIKQFLNNGNAFLSKGYILTRTIKKLHEHHMLLILSMKYIIDYFKIADKSMNVILEEYSECCQIVKGWYLRTCKYEITKNICNIETIIDQAFYLYQKELSILRGFYEICKLYV